MSRYSNRQLEIIHAAGTLLTQLGVNGLTTKKIAEKIGFSEAAIYRHFNGKQDVLLALLNYLSDGLEAQFLAIDPFLEPEDYFKALFSAQFSFFQENKHHVVAVFSEGLITENNLINSKVMALMALKRRYLLPVLDTGQKAGHFINGVSAESLANIIIGTFRLKMFSWKMSGFKFDIIEEGEKLIQDLLIIIKTK